MNSIHRDLAAGRWNEMPFVEQMANIGSEVERALKWKEKNAPDYSMRAFDRALELVDLTLASLRKGSQLKEVARTRELLVDFFCGNNEYSSRADHWRSYFLEFARAARLARTA